MATQTDVRLVDDLDGSDAVGTFGFAIDGKGYELDLSEDNRKKLIEAFEPFVAAARRSRRPAGFTTPARRLHALSGASTGTTGVADGTTIRAWAKANGIMVSDRGKIAHSTRQQYLTAHGIAPADTA